VELLFRNRPSRSLIIFVVLFGAIYSLISLVNHYYFRTAALDLGAYTNALYDYTHFRFNDSTVFKETPENLLADHFDLYLIIFSPLSLVFGTYTLLIVQIFFLLLGGIGVYAYFNSKKLNSVAVYAAAYYYLFFGVYAAVAFDYHSNVVAATLVPWFFYFVHNRNVLYSFLLMLAILVSKENISLWFLFICIGLAIEYRRVRLLRNVLILSAVFSGFYFILITTYVMPAFANNATYPHFNYSVLGESYGKAIIHLLSHPVESIRVLFTNHTNNPDADFVKAELHVLLVISGLPFLFWRPQYLIMLIPVYFQKLYHDNYAMWGIGSQYSIEFAPIMALGVFSVIADFRGAKWMKSTSVIFLVLSLAATIRTMDNTQLFTDKSKIRIYKSSHYSRDYDVREAHKQLSMIPKDAVVSAQSPFLPHLSLRDHIYQFPMIKDAEYLVYSEHEKYYPLTRVEFELAISEIRESNEWEVIYENEIVILKRGAQAE